MRPHYILLMSLSLAWTQDSRTTRPAEPGGVPLLVFPEKKTELSVWMKSSSVESKRDDPARCEVGGGALRMVSEKDSLMLATERGFPVRVTDWPRLRIRLRVTALPKGTDLARKSGDDAAFRVYVAFDRGGGLFSPPHTIAYTWTEATAAETVIQSAHFDNVRYLTVGSGKTEWVTLERDLAADYRKVFPTDKKGVPQLKGVVLKCDSNDTKSSAEAWLSCLELLPAAAGGGK
jgi:hypothetical protein